MKIFKTLVLFFALTFNLHSAEIDRLRVITDHWPPYNILKGGELSGMSVDLFELMLKKNDSRLTRENFKVTDWKTVYDSTYFMKNRMALTMARNKIRENDFKWVGPIDIKQSGLIAKKRKNIVIRSTKDLKKYKIAVVKNYSTHQMLRKAGLKENLSVMGGLFAVHKAVEKLVNDKVDMYSTSNTQYIMKILDKNSFRVKDFEIIKKYKKDKLYFAFNKKTDDKLIMALQNALDDLKKDGTYKKIKNKYFNKI